jgi:hypothetical protein
MALGSGSCASQTLVGRAAGRGDQPARKASNPWLNAGAREQLKPCGAPLQLTLPFTTSRLRSPLIATGKVQPAYRYRDLRRRGYRINSTDCFDSEATVSVGMKKSSRSELDHRTISQNCGPTQSA